MIDVTNASDDCSLCSFTLEPRSGKLSDCSLLLGISFTYTECSLYKIYIASHCKFSLLLF